MENTLFNQARLDVHREQRDEYVKQWAEPLGRESGVQWAQHPDSSFEVLLAFDTDVRVAGRIELPDDEDDALTTVTDEQNVASDDRQLFEIHYADGFAAGVRAVLEEIRRP